MENQYTGVFEQVDNWWTGFVEELPGCNVQDCGLLCRGFARLKCRAFTETRAGFALSRLAGPEFGQLPSNEVLAVVAEIAAPGSGRPGRE